MNDRPPPRRLSRFFILVSALVIPIAAAGIYRDAWFPRIWRPLLVLESGSSGADAIVVLGGESQARPVEAARLYREGVAPLVFIVGTGDTATNRQVLIQGGVPAERILMETESRSTLQNADFSKPLLEGAGVRRAVLVTSSFHARRALATFQQRIPGIEFGVATSRIGWWDTPPGSQREDEWAAIEMMKIPGYWILHGIRPWVKKTAPPGGNGQTPKS